MAFKKFDDRDWFEDFNGSPRRRWNKLVGGHDDDEISDPLYREDVMARSPVPASQVASSTYEMIKNPANVIRQLGAKQSGQRVVSQQSSVRHLTPAEKAHGRKILGVQGDGRFVRRGFRSPVTGQSTQQSRTSPRAVRPVAGRMAPPSYQKKAQAKWTSGPNKFRATKTRTSWSNT